jgi:two-component system response regulator QseB
MRVLFIGDHCTTLDQIAGHLRDRGYAVDAVRRGDEALAAPGPHDAVIVDLDLADMDGQELVSMLHAEAADRPILVLIATDDLERCLGALEKCAEDFIRKPVELLELEARLRAVLRRPGSRPEMQIAFGDISFDTVSRTAMVARQTIRLTRLETALLESLIRERGLIVPRHILGGQVYGFGGGVRHNTFDAVVSRLRRHLMAAGSTTTIETIRNLGYRLVAAAGNSGP